MSSAESKSRQLSGMYYNRGLDCAKVRDLSRAEDYLRISVQLDKTNLQARNLLGLVYYETGEIVAALREWVISQNLQPVRNPATAYIADVRKNPGRLRQMNQAIREYNEALRACREGNDDVAAISLRRIVSRNPRFVKADLLMALVDIHQEHYSHARKVLRRAVRVDRHNPLILRYLQEIDEQMGTRTSFDMRVSDANRSKKKHEDFYEEMEAESLTPQPLKQTSSMRERPAVGNLINIFFGLGMGILVVWFVIAPSVRASVSRSANEQIVNYTTTLATQQNRINELQNQIDDSASSANKAQTEAQNTQKAVDSYDNLIQAYTDYQNMDYEKAGDEIAKVDVSLLSTSAGEIYDSVKDSITQAAYNVYVTNGNEAFYEQNWSEAAAQFEKALNVVSDDYDSMNLLAQAYENNGDTQKAIQAYQNIVKAFPDTRRAEYAEASIENLGGTVQNSDSNAGTDGNASGTGDTGGTDTADTNEDTAAADTGDANAAADNTDDTGDAGTGQ